MKVLNILFFGALLVPAMGSGQDPDQQAQDQSQIQEQQADRNTDQSMSPQPDEDLGTGGSAISIDDLIGSSVRASNSNEEIGVLEDILMDSTGRPLAAIITVGEFLGIGEKEIAIDWSRVSVVPEIGPESASKAASSPANSDSQPEATGEFHAADSFVLMVNINEQTLKDVPGFGDTRE